jgi:hypothetical protein
MVEVRFRPDGKPEAQRIRDRLKPSNDFQTSDVHVQTGTGPTRVSHTTHRSAQNLEHHNPSSRSILRGDADADMADVVNRRTPHAGPPNFARKGR